MEFNFWREFRKLERRAEFSSRPLSPPQPSAKFKGEHFPRGSLGIMFISYSRRLQSWIPSGLFVGENKELYFFYERKGGGEGDGRRTRIKLRKKQGLNFYQLPFNFHPLSSNPNPLQLPLPKFIYIGWGEKKINLVNFLQTITSIY